MSSRKIRIAINGFGRIGRNVLRAIWETGATDFEVVAINDGDPIETGAHLLEFDSVHRRFDFGVEVKAGRLHIDGRPEGIPFYRIMDPRELPWKERDVDIVFECVGAFTDRDKAAWHLEAGAKQVLISAPGKGADKTIVWGVNHKTLTDEDIVVSAGSCTTNALAPLLDALLDEGIGVQRGIMTTIHSYTGDQSILDKGHKDLYRARAAAMSMVTTSTGAADAIGLVIPKLDGKLGGVSVRVPTPDVSLVDLVFSPKELVSVDDVNGVLTAASEGRLKDVLAVESRKLVSCDYIHNPNPSIVQLDRTKVVDEEMIQVFAWYDNEWGFPIQMLRVAREMAKLW